MVSNVNKIGTQKGGEGGEQHKENKVARVGREGTAQGKLMRCKGYSDFCLILTNSFATCLLFVSSVVARKDKNSNTLVVFSQTV